MGKIIMSCRNSVQKSSFFKDILGLWSSLLLLAILGLWTRLLSDEFLCCLEFRVPLLWRNLIAGCCSQALFYSNLNRKTELGFSSFKFIHCQISKFKEINKLIFDIRFYSAFSQINTVLASLPQLQMVDFAARRSIKLRRQWRRKRCPSY